jgi:vacuolar-type H+-ATPase subunit E/Vma4
LDKKALDNIAKKIRADAELKVKEYKRRAEQKRQEVLSHAEAGLEKELKQMRLKKEREIENHVNFTISQAKISGKRMILTEREKGIEEVFSEVISSAPEKDPEGYRAYLQRSIKHIKDVLGEGTVFCRPEDESMLKGMLPPGWNTDASLEGANPGIIGRSQDGNMEVDFTLARKLEDMKEELRKGVSEVLYGGNA